MICVLLHFIWCNLSVNMLKASNMSGSNTYATATSTSALTGFTVRPAWHVFRLRYEEKYGGGCESLDR